MSESNPARDAALRGLVERGVLSPAQAEDVRAALAEAEPERGRVRWTEIAGYIGGGLVLAGAVALAAASWEDLTDDARITLLSVLAVLAVGGAMLMTGGPQEMRGRRNRVTTVRRRISGVLLALASVLAAFAAGIAVEDGPWYAAPLVGLAVAAAGYAALPSAVGQVAVWGMSIGLVGTLVDELSPGAVDDYSLILGGAWLCLGLLWVPLAALGVCSERRLGIGLGAGLALTASQTVLAWTGDNAWGYGATLVVAALCMVCYPWQRAGVLLVMGILGVTIGLPEMVWDITGGAIGAAAVLLLAGAVLLVASWLGLLLHRRRADQSGGGANPPAAGPGGSGHPGTGPPASPAQRTGDRSAE